MTRLALPLRLGCAVLMLFVTASYVCAQEQDMSAAQKEVWQMEETYWKDVKESNASGYIALWHADFLGWPRDRDRPLGKKEIADAARSKMSAGHVASYEFLSKGVTVVGNVGITQYSVKATRVEKGGANVIYTSRVTHTWLKTGSTWEIIGGMSAPYESSSHTW
jgi:ketosteroid isomerase-like protein